jgi:hypothetical protein
VNPQQKPHADDGALSPLAIGVALTAAATAWMVVEWLSLVLR